MADEIVRIEADAEEIDEVINTLKNCDVPGHIANTNNPHQTTKEQVGLGNVDNTSDADKPISAAVQAVLDVDRAAIAELIDSGAKNMLQISCSSQTVNGVEFTVNSDGTITAEIPDGITSNAQLELLPRTDVPESWIGKTLVLSGSPTGGSTSTWRLVLQNATSGYTTITANEQGGNQFTIPDSVTRIRLVFTVYPNCPAQTITIKPMVCDKAAWDVSQEYVPYRPDYDELIARIVALEQATGINSVRSIANLAAESVADTAETEGEEVK